MVEFAGYFPKAGVGKINPLMDWNDWQLIRFFSTGGFAPAEIFKLELKIE